MRFKHFLTAFCLNKIMVLYSGDRITGLEFFCAKTNL